jgi:Cd2+/Zn2+-exporting ATPase
MSDRLELLFFLICLSRSILAIIRFNNTLAIGVKLIVLVFALVGFANLDLAILSDVGLTVFFISNGLRLATVKATDIPSRGSSEPVHP